MWHSELERLQTLAGVLVALFAASLATTGVLLAIMAQGLAQCLGFTVCFDSWTEGEPRLLLDYLYRHAVRPEFTCRFKWRKDSRFWDNRSILHFAVNDYHGERRLLHRITIADEKLD
jgi:Taurine catabolism dioxygenase TauD, TfdA family